MDIIYVLICIAVIFDYLEFIVGEKVAGIINLILLIVVVILIIGKAIAS